MMSADGQATAARSLFAQMGSDPADPLESIKDHGSGSDPLPQRDFLPGVRLSILGFGGLILAGMTREQGERLVAESIARGVNYFDVSPAYGAGEAEQRLGPALQSYRKNVILACKTLERTAAGARKELEESLRRLRSSHVDLYQFHAVNRIGDVRDIFAPGGAMEAFVRAREEGLVRFLGFSSHSVPIAMELLDCFRFDSVLFPVNYVCYARGNFGPQVLEKARGQGVARVALKAMACTPWPAGAPRPYANCWYRPIDDPAQALQALRFSLSEDVSAVFPPADERLYRMALTLASAATPLSAEERHELLRSARGLKPIMKAGKGDCTR